MVTERRWDSHPNLLLLDKRDSKAVKKDLQIAIQKNDVAACVCNAQGQRRSGAARLSHGSRTPLPLLPLSLASFKRLVRDKTELLYTLEKPQSIEMNVYTEDQGFKHEYHLNVLGFASRYGSPTVAFAALEVLDDFMKVTHGKAATRALPATRRRLDMAPLTPCQTAQRMMDRHARGLRLETHMRRDGSEKKEKDVLKLSDVCTYFHELVVTLVTNPVRP